MNLSVAGSSGSAISLSNTTDSGSTIIHADDDAVTLVGFTGTLTDGRIPLIRQHGLLWEDVPIDSQPANDNDASNRVVEAILRSRPLGRVDLPENLNTEIAKLGEFKFNVDYSEYAIGYWASASWRVLGKSPNRRERISQVGY